jgi:hypothetical protein
MNKGARRIAWSAPDRCPAPLPMHRTTATTTAIEHRSRTGRAHSVPTLRLMPLRRRRQAATPPGQHEPQTQTYDPQKDLTQGLANETCPTHQPASPSRPAHSRNNVIHNLGQIKNEKGIGLQFGRNVGRPRPSSGALSKLIHALASRPETSPTGKAVVVTSIAKISVATIHRAPRWSERKALQGRGRLGNLFASIVYFPVHFRDHFVIQTPVCDEHICARLS